MNFNKLCEQYYSFTLQILENQIKGSYWQAMLEDNAIEFWMQIQGKLHLYDPTKQEIKAWLGTCIQNFARDRIKQEKKLKQFKEEEQEKGEVSVDCLCTHEYTLQTTADVLRDLSSHSSNPQEIASQKELIAAVYCALELTFFGKEWLSAYDMLENDRKKIASSLKTSLSWDEYLLVLAERRAKSLSFYLYSPARFKKIYPYNPELIRAHVLQGVPYDKLAETMDLSVPTIKQYCENAVQLFNSILKQFQIDIQDYFNYRQIGLNATMRLVYKLLGVGENIDQAIVALELDSRLQDDILQYGLRGAVLQEQHADSILKKWWTSCDCETGKKKDWFYCWRYGEEVLSSYFQKKEELCTIWKRGIACKNLKTKTLTFAEFEIWFEELQKRFEKVLNRLGLSLSTGSVYYRWVLHSVKNKK